MEEIIEIKGGRPLNGRVKISGAKNAILPLMAASVLTNRTCIFKNVPDISDVTSMIELLRSHGVSAMKYDDRVEITASNPEPYPNDPSIGSQFRASFLMLGPLLARLGKGRVYLPGGDDIDSKGRPIDIHVTNLRSLGANVNESVHVEAIAHPHYGLRAPNRSIVLPVVSVGATQNTIKAACVANGTTVIENASIEPETIDLVKFLRKLGANIQVDEDNRKISVTGQPIENYQQFYQTSSIEHTVIPDRIVAGTYAIAAAITGGSIDLLVGAEWDTETILRLWYSEFWRFLAAGGIEVTEIPGGFRVARKRDRYGEVQPITPVNVRTNPFPGFPTDLHPQWAALMCFSNGSSWIEEQIFDKRFNYVAELRKLGVSISQDVFNQKKINITGNQGLHSRLVTASAGDIRAGAALILVALARNGTTRIRGTHHVKRGYENFVPNFRSCGSSMELKLIPKE